MITTIGARRAFSLPWLSVEAAQVDAAGQGEYLCAWSERVSRRAPQGEVRFASNGGEVLMAVIMQVVDGSRVAQTVRSAMGITVISVAVGSRLTPR